MPEDEAAQFAHMLEVRRQIEAQAAAAQRKVRLRTQYGSQAICTAHAVDWELMLA